MKRFGFLFAMTLLVVACAPQPSAAPEPSPRPPDAPVTSPPQSAIPTVETPEMHFAPHPDDANLSRGEVFINEASLLIRESFPPQIVLVLSGDLPTPCHQLRTVIPEPDAENRIAVEVYSVADPNQVCAQVLEAFQENIELGTFSSGHYTVWVNGELVGEFDS